MDRLLLAPVVIRALEDLFAFNLLPLSLATTSILVGLSLASAACALSDDGLTRSTIHRHKHPLLLWLLCHVLTGLSLSLIISRDLLVLSGPLGPIFLFVLLAGLAWPPLHFLSRSRGLSLLVVLLEVALVPVVAIGFATVSTVAGLLVVPYWVGWLVVAKTLAFQGRKDASKMD